MRYCCGILYGSSFFGRLFLCFRRAVKLIPGFYSERRLSVYTVLFRIGIVRLFAMERHEPCFQTSVGFTPAMHPNVPMPFVGHISISVTDGSNYGGRIRVA